MKLTIRNYIWILCALHCWILTNLSLNAKEEKTDRITDLAKLAQQDIPCLAPLESGEKAWGKKVYYWEKKIVTFAFLDNEGSGSLRDRVTVESLKWNGHANITLKRADIPKEADVRIAFRPLGHWSRIGKTASDVPKAEQTMNLQIADGTSADEVRRVVLHEFGHALGLMHEHQHPESPIRWREDAVLQYYSGPPNYWNEAKIKSNVLARYSSSGTTSSGFDPDSIMLYRISPSLAYNFSSKTNTRISTRDIAALKLAYP